MGRKRKGDDWLPLWIDKWLFGSTRHELDVEERSVWIDLMVLSYKDEGWIRANEGVPFPPEQLAGMFVVPVKLLKKTIEKCVKVGKLIRHDDGTLYVPSKEEYELSKRHKRRFESDTEDGMSAKPDTMSPEADTKNRIDKNREEEKRVEEAAAPPLPSFDYSSLKEEDAVDLWWRAWQLLHCRTWETDDEYIPTRFERLAVQETVTPERLERMIAYAWYYHQKDAKVGLEFGRQKPTVDKFLKAQTVYCAGLRGDDELWSQAKSWTAELLAEMTLQS